MYEAWATLRRTPKALQQAKSMRAVGIKHSDRKRPTCEKSALVQVAQVLHYKVKTIASLQGMRTSVDVIPKRSI